MFDISRSKSISKLLALKWWLATGVILFSIWYYIFGAQSIVYTLLVEEDGRCYSPNHEYYIIRTQSRWEYFYHSYPGEYGMVSLYDKTGKLLYEKKTLFDEQGGPTWFDGKRIGRKDTVFFTGSSEDESWGYDLPTSPGNSNKDCN